MPNHSWQRSLRLGLSLSIVQTTEYTLWDRLGISFRLGFLSSMVYASLFRKFLILSCNLGKNKKSDRADSKRQIINWQVGLDHSFSYGYIQFRQPKAYQSPIRQNSVNIWSSIQRITDLPSIIAQLRAPAPPVGSTLLCRCRASQTW